MRPQFARRSVQLVKQRCILAPTTRPFHVSHTVFQEQLPRAGSSNFYKSHGRALFKALTLAFFSYQCFYWTWLTFETEAEKDGKNREIKSLESEIRLLEEGRNSHKIGGLEIGSDGGKRLLEEKKA
jgi:hypothetical protein